MKHLLAVLLLLASACDSALTECGKQSDLSGHWLISATPLATDAGAPALPMAFTIDAQLTQAGKTDFIGIGHYVYGTLTASDPSVFGTITIPMLMHNDGGKTGVVRGCTIGINVPITTSVTDDDTDQGPLRLGLTGQIDEKGMMQGGTVPSTVVLASDPSNEARAFAWTAEQK